MFHGGAITEIRKIASLGEVYGAEIAPHGYYGPVGHVASLQSMTGARSFRIEEWDAGMDAVFAAATCGAFRQVRDSQVTLAERPGIEMDWAEFDRRFPYRSQSLRPPGGG